MESSYEKLMKINEINIKRKKIVKKVKLKYSIFFTDYYTKCLK